MFRANRPCAIKEAPRKLAASLLMWVGLCLILAPNVTAKQAVEDESGVYLGLKLGWASLHTDETSPSFHVEKEGGGVQIDVGYRFNPVFMLELVLGGSNHDTSDPQITAKLATVQLFGHYRFAPDKSFRPYLKGGFIGCALVLESGSLDNRISGGGVAFGGGFKYFFSPHFSLGADLTHNIVRFDKAKLSLGDFSYESSIDEQGQATTLEVSLGYSF